jgi:DNA-directed RNA polymerase subunit RPC12/RpoP
MNKTINITNLSHDIHNLPLDIQIIIHKYSFNLCKKCNNKYTNINELVEIIDNKTNFRCKHCKISANLQNLKCRQILGI